MVLTKTIYLVSLNIQEKTMIASDEEQEYGIFALLSDVGGGLGIFLGLSFLRLVVANFKSIFNIILFSLLRLCDDAIKQLLKGLKYASDYVRRLWKTMSLRRRYEGVL